MTWRDTKAALVLFIRSSDPTDIIRKANESIANHAMHVRTESETTDQRSDYVLRSPFDAERLVHVAFIPVVTPSDF